MAFNHKCALSSFSTVAEGGLEFKFLDQRYWSSVPLDMSVTTDPYMNVLLQEVHMLLQISQCITGQLKNGSCCTVRPGKVSCLQKFRHLWMIIRDLLFESGSNEATKIKNKYCKGMSFIFLIK